MKIKILNQPDELNSCEPFFIRHLLWNTTSIPQTWGRIGFARDQGFFLTMTCEEANPKRTFTEANAPVYFDSAMEAFFQFAPGGTLSGRYLNFEMNANGALLAMHGTSRTDRTAFTPAQLAACRCSSCILEKSWSVSLVIPTALLEEIYGGISFTDGSLLACNFYKLSESTEIEHYASYAPVLSETPNFHLPEFFERCVLENYEYF